MHAIIGDIMDGAFSNLPLRQRAWIAAVFGACVSHVFSWVVHFPSQTLQAHAIAYVSWLSRTHSAPRMAVPIAYVIGGYLLISSSSIAGGYAVGWYFRTPRSVRWALAAPLAYGVLNLILGHLQSTVGMRQMIRRGAHLSAATITGLKWEMALMQMVSCLLSLLFVWAGWTWGWRRFRKCASPVPAAE